MLLDLARRAHARTHLILAGALLLLGAHLVAPGGVAAQPVPERVAIERVVDGDFELDSEAWTFEDGAERCTLAHCSWEPAAGEFFAATANFVPAPAQSGHHRTGTITQLVSVPETPAAMSFRMRRAPLGGTYSELVVRYDGVELIAVRPPATFTLVTVPIPAGLIGPTPRPLTFEATCENSTDFDGVCDRFDIDVVSLASPTAAPSNLFTLGKPKLNKRKGLAKLPVRVPGAGSISLAGRGIKKATGGAGGAGTVRLTVRAAGKARRTLERTGRVKVVAKVTYTPTGGLPNTQRRKVTLRLRG